MPDHSNRSEHEALVMEALLYAGGELEGAAAVAFEARLADDQEARDILAHAVELCLTAAGAPGRPDRSWRAAARARLQPRRSLWARLSGRRLYRGHPVVWSLLGAAAASLLLMLASPRSSIPAPAPAPAAVLPTPTPEVASYWAQLQTSNHLARARTESARRRQRIEERARPRTDERRGPHTSPIPDKANR